MTAGWRVCFSDPGRRWPEGVLGPAREEVHRATARAAACAWAPAGATVPPRSGRRPDARVNVFFQFMDVSLLCWATGGSARVNDEESLDVRWFAVDALPELADFALTRIKRAHHRRTHLVRIPHCYGIAPAGAPPVGGWARDYDEGKPSPTTWHRPRPVSTVTRRRSGPAAAPEAAARSSGPPMASWRAPAC